MNHDIMTRRLFLNVLAALTFCIFTLLYPSARAEQVQLLTPTKGGPAPEFSALDLQGKTHTLADYKGGVLIVNFWATWCPPCVKEMPALQRTWEQLRGDGVQVLGFSMGDSAEDIERFLKIIPVGFPLLLDENMEQSQHWSLKGLPTTFIVDTTGQIVFTVLGEREWDNPAIIEQIRTLLPAAEQATQ